MSGEQQSSEKDAVTPCRLGPLETEGHFIGERFCATCNGHVQGDGEFCQRAIRPASEDVR